MKVNILSSQQLIKNKESLNLFFHNHRALILIICFALFLRIILFVAVKPYNEQILQDKILINDAPGYHNLAISILEKRSFSYLDLGAQRTPGYPAFIAIIYFMFGIRPWVVLLIQILLNIGSLIMVYLWAKVVFDKKISIISAALYAIEPHAIFYSVNLMTETLFVFIFLASMVFLTYGLKRKKIIFFWLSGFLLGLAALVRPIIQFFPLAIIIMILIYVGIKWVFRLKAIMSFLFIFVLTLSPWLCRNYLKYGYSSLSCNYGGDFLRQSVAAVEASKTGKSFEQVRAEFKKNEIEQGFNEKNNPFDNSRICKKIAVNYIITNWKYYISRHIRGIINMFINLDTKAISNFIGLKANSLPYELFASPNILTAFIDFFKVKSIHEIVIAMSIGFFLLLTYFAFIFGSFLMISEKKYFYLAVTLIIIAYFSVLSGVLGLVRYKLPILPFYLVVSSKGIFEILSRIEKCRNKF